MRYVQYLIHQLIQQLGPSARQVSNRQIPRSVPTLSLTILALITIALLYFGTDPTSVQGAGKLWQESPLLSILESPLVEPLVDPTPTAVIVPTAAPLPPIVLEPPLAIGNPAPQTSLPLLGALIATIIVVVLLAVRRRK